MMVLVNDKYKVKIYAEDTQSSFLIRIAAKMGTLPQYLYIQEELPEDIKSLDKINVIDILSVLKEYSSRSESFQEFYNIVLIDKWSLLSETLNFITDIVEPYIAYGKESDELAKLSDLLSENEDINDIINNLDSNIENVNDLNLIWDRRVDIVNNLEEKIKSNNKNSEERVTMFKEIEKAKSVFYTDLEDTSIEFKIFIDMGKLSLLEIFNMLVLTRRIPYASCQDFYKIQKHVLPTWPISSLDDGIILKIFSKKRIIENNFKEKLEEESENYMNSLIQIEDDLVSISFRIDMKPKNIDTKDCIQSIYDIIPSLTDAAKKSIEMKESSVSSVYFVLNQTLDYYIWADMVMNDPIFSSVLYIDDREKATKYIGEKGITINTINMYYEVNETEKYSIILTSKIYDSPTNELAKARYKPKQKTATFDVKIGDPYVRILIRKVNNKDTALQIQKQIGKFISIYNTKFNTVLKEYQNFLKDFTPSNIQKKSTIKSTDPKKSRKYKLSDVDPYIFRNNYATRCQSPGQPVIIDEEEAEKAKSSGKEVMLFPKTSDEGVEQHYYVCNDKDFKYPGLIVNPIIANNYNKEVPLLPCCFRTQHSQNKSKPYYKYLNDIEIGDMAGVRENIQQDRINTERFAGITNTGVARLYGRLPPSLNNLLKTLSPLSLNTTYERRGVHDTNNSFLECIIEIMEPQIFHEQDSYNDRKIKLNAYRTKLASDKKNIALCSQNNYDLSQRGIQMELRNTLSYFDPRKYSQFLEELFDCEIYTFTRKRGEQNTELLVPNHKEYYYKRKYTTKRPVIIIYEHWGSRTDESNYPRCEIVLTWTKRTENQSEELNAIFDKNMAIGLRQLLDSMRRGYILDVPASDINFPLKNLPEILKQGCDSYGKTRYIKFKSQYFNSINIITDPIPPLKVIKTSHWTPNIKLLSIEDALQAATDDLSLDVNSLRKTINKQGYLTSIESMIGNVKIAIPIIPIKYSDVQQQSLNLPEVYSSVSYPVNFYSELEEYNRYKKLSRYTVSYMLWLYSIFLSELESESDSEPLSDLDTIYEFQKKYLEIDPEFEYGNVNNNFSMDSSLLRNGKLIVRDLETKKRLVYTLRIESRNKKFIKAYKDRQTIENFYEDLTDFDEYPEQIILEGDNSVRLWVEESTYKLIIHSVPQPNINSPYFFRNTTIAQEVFLAKNYTSYEDVLNQFDSDSYRMSAYDFDIDRYKNFVVGSNPKNNRVIVYIYPDHTQSNTIMYTILTNTRILL